LQKQLMLECPLLARFSRPGRVTARRLSGVFLPRLPLVGEAENEPKPALKNGRLSHVTFARLGAKDTGSSVGANGTRKCDIGVEAQSVAPLPVPTLDIVPTDVVAVGSGAADRTYNEACRE
jgi:hypothetical protein